MNKKEDSELLMYFERSSGYPGYRCQRCGKWEYLQDASKHKCPEQTSSNNK